ncbi:hypothetical protein [Riemerella anatipestifer]|uniref:Uncharacterized protein n=1 Tax=Riemerella anatipestifer TaxID=34085 RepID=A0A1S7DRG6_RIEAN|nr:hypothetical protein [Riemerella anatipestifer]AQY21641.1 hypothetical protein AB406_0683 [Riemerella anatipestifer]MCO4303008.1 hypothetical protein [Riemerella anatipestifer]MCO7353380.1 hypothetical protein [Riemerella anatipestifer]MCQ4038614.1 hypothetical protein [Riemerella anatipestifer]MCT6760157.1 hypothetical protein [Riemerella anatipestifer]
MNKEKKKLFRKVNTTTYGVRHRFGQNYNRRDGNQQGGKGKMKRGVERGLDYTPLFRFLLSKVGSDWDSVFNEAKSRLDRTEPIFWMVALTEDEKQDFVRIGESSYFSGLFVDENNILQKCTPELNKFNMQKFCSCCTYTFNGEVY